jgi:hypothetical protein
MKLNGNLTFAVLGSGQIENAIIERLASAPTMSGTTGAGRIYYDTTVNQYFYWNGSAWQPFATGTSTVSSFSAGNTGLTPSTATTGAVTLGGTLNATSGGTGFNSYTAGQILYASSATALSVLNIGAAHTVLKTTDGATLSWAPVDLTADVSGILPPANGGTGVANTNTITLGGNLTTAGAFTTAGAYSVTLTATGATTLTLPTSGTLLSTGNAAGNYVSSIAGTLNQINASAATGAVTLSLSSTLVAPGSVEVTTTLQVDGLTANTALIANSSKQLASVALTNGQFVIGSSGGAPAAGSITGGSGVTVTPGPNSITIANSGVLSVSGTANQIDATTNSSTGAVTLALDPAIITPGSLEVTSYLKADALVYESTSVAVAASATPGTAITSMYNVVSSTTNGTYVQLPTPTYAGLEITLVNLNTNSTVNVMPQTGGAIDGAGLNTAVQLPAGGTVTYQAVSASQWYTIDPVMVGSGSGISVLYGNGATTLSNTGVTSFATTLSGLTVNAATGAVSLGGTLGVASGGTGDTTLTLNGVLFGNGTSPIQATAAGSEYNVLVAGVSGVPAFGTINLSQAAAVGTSILGLANGGTNAALTAVAGAPVYSTGTALAVGTAGTVGQALISGGTNVPTWQNVASTLTTNQILEGNGSGAFTANGATFVGSSTFSGVTLQGTVTNSTDAVTKAYVDAAVSSLNVHEAVDYLADATNTQITGATYTAGTTDANGGTGIGATLTGAASAALTVDGIAVVVNDRILVNSFANSGATATQNGIYVVTNAGSSTAAFVLTRATDYNDSTSDQVVPGDFVFVTGGNTYKSTGWVETDLGSLGAPTDAIKIGTDKIYFTQFSGAGSYIAGSGLTLTGSTFSANVDGVTTYIDAANDIAVKSSATANQVLLSDGASTTPTWGALPLNDTNAVTGTLAVGNGGTGATTFATDGVLFGNGTGALSATAAGATGQVLAGTTGGAPSFQTLSGLAVTTIAGTANEILVNGNTTATSGAVTLTLPSVLDAPGAVNVAGNLTVTGQTYESAASVAAAGTSQATGTALTANYNIVSATTAGEGVVLPTPSVAGLEVSIVNTSSQNISVYPAVGGTIDALALNASFNLPAGGTWTGQAASATQWYSIDPVTVAGTGINVVYGGGQTLIANTGVLSVTGTANQITAATVNGAVTLSLPSTLSLGGVTATSITDSGLTANSFLFSGTGGLLTTTAAPTNGQLLIGSTGAAPVAATLTAGTGISVTNGAGSITIANTGLLSFTTTLAGLTATTTSGAVALGGTLGATSGGTGYSSYAIGDILYASSTTALSALAVGAAGTVLHGGTTPTYSAVSLTADVSGILPSANGGTGVSNSSAAVGTALVASATGQFTAAPIQYTFSSSTTNGGSGPATSFTIVHGLNQQFVNVTVYDSTFNQIIPQSVVLTDATTVTVTVNSAIDIYAVIMGVPGVAFN